MSKEELTIEEIDVELIAKQLSAKYNCTVQPLVFQKDNGEKIIGYIKEPSRILKARTLDAAATGSFTAGLTLFDTCLLKQESDPRLYSDKSEDDAIVLGGALAAIDMIKIQVNEFIKK
jgi:hypothetical protein